MKRAMKGVKLVRRPECLADSEKHTKRDQNFSNYIKFHYRLFRRDEENVKPSNSINRLAQHNELK